MKNYIKPELIRRLLADEDIVTASGGDNFEEDIFGETPEF